MFSDNPFKKSGLPILAESTRIENETFQNQTAPSEANFKTYLIGSTKWSYGKERRKFCFNLKDLL